MYASLLAIIAERGGVISPVRYLFESAVSPLHRTESVLLGSMPMDIVLAGVLGIVASIIGIVFAWTQLILSSSKTKAQRR
jgi:hypothetical protein